jgi:hypothetical protein
VGREKDIHFFEICTERGGELRRKSENVSACNYMSKIKVYL